MNAFDQLIVGIAIGFVALAFWAGRTAEILSRQDDQEREG